MATFCTNCGNEINDNNLNFCPNCGFELAAPKATSGSTPYQGQNYQNTGYSQNSYYNNPMYGNDRSNEGLEWYYYLLIFIFPIIAIIPYFSYRNSRPGAANTACALGIGMWILNMIILFAIS